MFCGSCRKVDPLVSPPPSNSDKKSEPKAPVIKDEPKLTNSDSEKMVSFGDDIFTPEERQIVRDEYSRLLEHQPELFSLAWAACANRSESIKIAFHLDLNTPAENNTAFMALAPYITRFFDKIIKELNLQSPDYEDNLELLGGKHVGFVQRGFNINFWDLYLMCLIDVLQDSFDYVEEKNRADYKRAFEHLIRYTVHYMRVGFNKQRQFQNQ